MRLPFLNKSKQPEPEPVVDPRARLVARIKIAKEKVADTEVECEAGFAARSTLDAARAELARLKQELANLDAAAAANDTVTAARAERGPALLAEARQADADIDAAVRQLGAALAKARPTIEAIESEFRLDPNYAALAAPFDGFQGQSLVARLKFWAEGVAVVVGVPGGSRTYGAFAERLAQYQRLSEPPRPIEIVRHVTPEDPQARMKRRQQALRNSKMTARLTEAGVIAS